MTPETCPECKGTRIKTSRRPLASLVGIVIVFLGSAVAIPTFGLSLIVVIWGVFLTLPKHRCKDCGWSQKA